MSLKLRLYWSLTWIDPEDGSLLDQTRKLGLVVCRGPTIVLISPTDGVEEIENPFAAPPE